MIKIGIVIGSTRPGRNADNVARWVHDLAVKRDDACFELIDLADFPLPHLDEPLPAAAGQYANDHTKAWSERVASFDGFVFVTPEYNHSTSGVLKNAIDYLYYEWQNKAAGFVSYGMSGGVRATEHLRQVLGQLKVADVPGQVALSLLDDFESFSIFRPAERHEAMVTTMLDQVVAWSGALKPLRAAA